MLTFPITFGGAFSVDYSCDFPGTDDYFSRSHGLSSRQIWTCAFWAERDVSSTLEYILSTDSGGSDSGVIFTSTNRVALYDWDSATYDIRASGGSSGTTGVWAHWTVRVDTTSATASDRVRLYKDGSLLSLVEFNTMPAQNFTTLIGAGGAHNIGRLSEDGTGDFNGRIAEFCLVDGSALPPTFFRSSGGLPIYPNVTWGTGGFWLRFLESSNLGKDYSGNGNDWTVNGGLTRSTDVP